jgi:protoporphyrinogen oxidase
MKIKALSAEDRKRDIVILGAGPTGLGAAQRLHELGIPFRLFEKEHHAGGLASSFLDDNGFTWDVGGHVQFSHYPHFDEVMDSVLGDEWLHHEREAWVWMRDRFIPYPFQNNIRHLPPEEMRMCLRGLIETVRNRHDAPPANFEEWIRRSFGDGIAQSFMLPYNFKVWACHPSAMTSHWVGDRVAQIDLERIVFNILEGRDDAGWGPNNLFRFPLRGGTGEIWRRVARTLPERSLAFGKTVTAVDTRRKQIRFTDGLVEEYGILISTLPLNQLVSLSDLDHLKPIAEKLRYSGTHIVGIGLKGAPAPQLKTKCWMYFPESNAPFYRATVFSNYSPHNVPDIDRFWSLMVEVSESGDKPVDRSRVVDDCIKGLVATRLIESASDIVSAWPYYVPQGYPTPSRGRDQLLNALQPALEECDVFSRGRFGAWKYEVSNQDHSFMQGVELADRLCLGAEEATFSNPEAVNARKPAPFKKAAA